MVIWFISVDDINTSSKVIKVDIPADNLLHPVVQGVYSWYFPTNLFCLISSNVSIITTSALWVFKWLNHYCWPIAVVILAMFCLKTDNPSLLMCVYINPCFYVDVLWFLRLYGVIGMLINQKSRRIYGFVMASVIAPLAPCWIGNASVHSLPLFTMSWCCHHAKSTRQGHRMWKV